MTPVFLLLVSILAVVYGPAAVVGYPEGAPPESCYEMFVNHTDNFGRPRPSRDCGPDCDHSLEVLGAVVSGSNRTRIEGNGSVTTYECETVYEILLNSSGNQFEGYLVEARETTQSGDFDETSSIWGEWIYDGNDPFHAVLCDRSITDDEGPFLSAVTQNNTQMEFTNISVYWKAPDQRNTTAAFNELPESLTFWVTIVEDVANSFFPIKGPVLARDCREPPVPTPSSPTPSLSPSPSLPPPTATTSQPAVPPVTSESQPGPSSTPMDEEDDEEDDSGGDDVLPIIVGAVGGAAVLGIVAAVVLVFVCCCVCGVCAKKVSKDIYVGEELQKKPDWTAEKAPTETTADTTKLTAPSNSGTVNRESAMYTAESFGVPQ